MKKSFRPASRSGTPWDSIDDKALNPLQKFLKYKYKAHFYAHHQALSETGEANLLNSILVTKCHICGSTNIIKYGRKNNLVRYYCKDCKHTFVITTGTIFDHHKISIEEWIEFCLNLFGYGSTNLTSKNNKNSITTTNYWLNKVFLLLKNYQDDIMLSGKVYIDEKYYRKRSNQIKKRADGKKPAGLSRNQDCIFTGCDLNGHIYAKVNGSGKPSMARCWEALGNHIYPGSTLIHDKERSHRILVDRLELNSIVYDSKECCKLDDKHNPLNPINRVHDAMEKFLNSHSGFTRNHLQDYLNLFVFMNGDRKYPLIQAYKLIEMGLTKPIILRYRELYQLKTR